MKKSAINEKIKLYIHCRFDDFQFFWIRDYALSLESGFVSREEQKHMLLLTASTQCNQTWITGGGGMVPYGAVADHIRIDDMLPIYYPGSYDYDNQGSPAFGKTPPYGDQFLFIHMAWFYVNSTGDNDLLNMVVNSMPLINRLELAFRVPPAGKNHLVYTTPDFRGVDFGFRDVIEITGYLIFPSILKYRAASEMAELFELLDYPEKAASYREIAGDIKAALPGVFSGPGGMLRASTGKSRQTDVWGTALAVYFGILEGENKLNACRTLAESYVAGTISFRGNIRHIPTTDDFNESTAWEYSLAAKNTYQNGAYWGTPTGWVCYAIAQVDPAAAGKLAKEYIDDLMETDFRKGPDYGGPYECFHPETGNLQNPVYLTTVTCPFAVFKERD